MNQKMTEKYIQTRLYDRYFTSFQFAIPNSYLYEYWESDLLFISKSDYITEIEIKTSRSDFFADAKKTIGTLKKSKSYIPTTKYDALLSGQYITRSGKTIKIKRPNRFYYAVPKGLINVDEVPEWAGLYEIEGKVIKDVKRPKRLHNNKITEKDRYKILKSIYFRYMELWKKQ